MTHRPIKKSRTAFSLIEIVLVLAILVAIGAIVAPSFGDAFLRQRLQVSADKLRTEWDRARLTAMKTGQTQMFQCVLGSGEYSIEPYLSGSDMVNAGAGATLITSGGTVVESTAGGGLTTPGTSSTTGTGKKLEEDITFVTCTVSGDMRAASVAQAQGGIAAIGTMNQMVLFYSDGSTSTAEIVIQDTAGLQRAVRMRGLTGSTQVLVPGEIPTIIAPTSGASPSTSPTSS